MNLDSPTQFQTLINQVADTIYSYVTPHWWLAFSGGLDSTVLLHICAYHLGLHRQSGLTAVYINHQLQADSGAWGQHCKTVCASLDVTFQSFDVSVMDVQNRQGKGVEASARDARYQVFEGLLQQGSGLLMAHHQDDQAETFMLRALRGSGVKGLSGIPEQRALGRGFLLRPLLSANKPLLRAYAEHYKLSWIEDPSNQSTDFDRNYLRQIVLPSLTQRWPDTAQRFAQSAALSQQAERLNQDLAEIDLAAVEQANFIGKGLSLRGVLDLAVHRQINLIRYWLAKQVDYLPDGEQVRHWLAQFQHAGEDAQPEIIWRTQAIRRYQGCLYQMPLSAPKCTTIPLKLTVSERVEESTNVGCLVGSWSPGLGLRYQDGQQCLVSFDKVASGYVLAGRKGTKTLKKIFQENGVPPWLRGHWPLLLIDGVPAALLGFDQGPLVIEGFQVKPDELGFYPQWYFHQA